MACWSTRGCDDELQGRCPHAIDPSEKCPSGCYYTQCTRPTHRVTSDPALVFDPAVDRDAAAKEICVYCEFFLTRGPRLVR
ncbi:MAG: hypothetical protein ABFC80_02380 [Coriobacteriales bacterium]